MADRGLAQDLKEAQALVMAGLVFSGDTRLEKPGQAMDPDSALSVRSKEHPFVGRGGVKLEAALSHWGIQVEGLQCLDMGASTGGFTDCLLRRGAAKVYAVDSGTNQLDWRLRNDPRVSCMEQQNVLDLELSQLGGELDFACIDLSLTSLENVFPVLLKVLKQGARWVALIKPQYQVGPEDRVHGVVKNDDDFYRQLCDRIAEVAELTGLGPLGVISSPIKGREGNAEFLISGQKI